MPTLKVPLNNFQFGEVSPSLSSRTDTPLYNNAAEQVRNFWIRAEGGLKEEQVLNFIRHLEIMKVLKLELLLLMHLKLKMVHK